MEKIKNKPTKNIPVKKRKTHPQIIITATAALAFIVLAFATHWLFIVPAIILWWMNKKALNKII
ncbi:MAG: hypothetical protein AABY16_00330 [Nanoarchaeota archaeon]